MIIRILILTFTLFTYLLGQNLNIPDDIELNDEEDYKRTEKFVVECIDLIESTPKDEKTDDLKFAMAFSVKWITGCPYITINLSPLSTKIIKINSIFSIIYIGGWTKTAILNSEDLSIVEGNYASIQSVLNYYKNNKTITRSELLDKLLDFDEDELIQWIENELEES